jgi:hypothetical protein
MAKSTKKIPATTQLTQETDARFEALREGLPGSPGRSHALRIVIEAGLDALKAPKARRAATGATR